MAKTGASYETNREKIYWFKNVFISSYEEILPVLANFFWLINKIQGEIVFREEILESIFLQFAMYVVNRNFWLICYE